MPSFYSENNAPLLGDDERRSLHKVVDLLQGGTGAAGTSTTPTVVTPTAFRATANFTRPADTTTYAQYDAITNSTSAPTVLTLAIPGAAAGDFVDIRNVRVNTGTKPSGTKLSANVFLAKSTFTATNDNAELSIADATAEGGAWVSCANQFQTALNYRCSSDPTSMLVELTEANLYAILQANTAWAPGNADKVTLVIEGFLYKV